MLDFFVWAHGTITGYDVVSFLQRLLPQCVEQCAAGGAVFVIQYYDRVCKLCNRITVKNYPL